jgi:hypothetical protein
MVLDFVFQLAMLHHNFTCGFYECKTWLLTLREKRRLRVFENRALRRLFGPRRDEVKRKLEKNYITRNFMICTVHTILFG